MFALCLFAAGPAVAETGAGDRAGTLAAAEARYGRNSPNLLPVIATLAEFRRRDGALDEAASLRRRALAISVAAFGFDSDKAAAAMAMLAGLDIERERYLDAEPLLIVAAQVFGRDERRNAATLAGIEAGLARVSLARGAFKAAEAQAARAVALGRRIGPAETAGPLRALGAALTRERRFAEAERALDDAMAEARRGGDPLDEARSLSDLGNLRLHEHRAAEALPLLEQAAAIDQARLGKDHPTIADDLHDIGLADEALNRDDLARLVLQKALDILEAGASRDSPRLAYVELELSRLYGKCGDAVAARIAAKNARRILDKAEAETRRREREI